MSEYGPDINHNGIIIALTQIAYIDNYMDGVAYYASGVDAEGNRYRIRWDCLAAWLAGDQEDQSDACDWEQPAEVYKL